MDFLELISKFLPMLGFMTFGIVGKSGASGKEKEKEEEEEENEEEEEETEEETTIKKIQKDPDAISNLLSQKRAANAQAKDLRIENKKLKAAADKLSQDELKAKGKFEELSTKLEADNASKDAKVQKRMILNALQIEAIGLGMINKGDVALAEMSGVDFNDESYEVTGAKDAVEALKKKSPYLFKGKKKDDDDDDDDDEPANEEPKGKMKANIAKFDVTKHTDLNERFNLGDGNKKKKG